MQTLICRVCSKKFEADSETSHCPRCAASLTGASVVNTDSPPRTSIFELKPKDYLQAVRKQSCYSALRVIINLLTGCLVLVGFVAFAAFLFGALRQSDASPFSRVSASCIFVIYAVLVLAFHELVSLLLDVADTLIDIGRRQRH